MRFPFRFHHLSYKSKENWLPTNLFLILKQRSLPEVTKGPKSLTERSLSAVGLFFGFFVSAILTKLWNVADLKEKESLC